MAIPYNEFITGDSAKVLATLPAGVIDLVVTSPPYDDLRQYDGYSFDFATIAKHLTEALAVGGVIMWNVGDAVIDGSETGASFRQALHFKEECGLRLHDTMIYEKCGSPFPASDKSNRYTQIFEYCFILSKGKPKTANLIRDKRNTWGGTQAWAEPAYRQKDGSMKPSGRVKPVISEIGIRDNIWKIKSSHGFGQQNKMAYKHPATMPLALAADHIKTWTNEGDIVLDPFSGSGTTAVAAASLSRAYIGIEISENYNDLARARVKAEVGGLIK